MYKYQKAIKAIKFRDYQNLFNNSISIGVCNDILIDDMNDQDIVQYEIQIKDSKSNASNNTYNSNNKSSNVDIDKVAKINIVNNNENIVIDNNDIVLRIELIK